MKAGQERQVFGRRPDPDVDVELPFQLKASQYSLFKQAASRVQNLE